VPGHDLEALMNVFDQVPFEKPNKPSVVIANTIKGHGISFIEDNVGMASSCAV
jgi:transketolase